MLNDFDIGNDLQNAYNDGFRDGMDSIESLIYKFKKKNYLREHDFIIALRSLQTYIEENKPRRADKHGSI